MSRENVIRMNKWTGSVRGEAISNWAYFVIKLDIYLKSKGEIRIQDTVGTLPQPPIGQKRSLNR